MMNVLLPDYGLVSIITPSYNSARFIKETIESIIAQTYTNWELLITDDCSTDETVAIVQDYCQKDARIKLFVLDENGGAGRCRNHSIAHASGRFIAFCDSDDYWNPLKLEKQLRFMCNQSCALSYSSYMTVTESGVIEGIRVATKRQTIFSMLCNNGIGCLSAIYDTEKVDKVYMPTLRKRQDWGLWLTILKKCKIAYGMKEPLAYYRIRTNSISSQKKSLVKFNIAVYREVMNFSLIKSYFYFVCLFVPSFFTQKLLHRIVNR